MRRAALDTLRRPSAGKRRRGRRGRQRQAKTGRGKQRQANCALAQCRGWRCSLLPFQLCTTMHKGCRAPLPAGCPLPSLSIVGSVKYSMLFLKRRRARVASRAPLCDPSCGSMQSPSFNDPKRDGNGWRFPVHHSRRALPTDPSRCCCRVGCDGCHRMRPCNRRRRRRAACCPWRGGSAAGRLTARGSCSGHTLARRA